VKSCSGFLVSVVVGIAIRWSSCASMAGARAVPVGGAVPERAQGGTRADLHPLVRHMGLAPKIGLILVIAFFR